MDQRLTDDTIHIAHLGLCELRQMKDGELDWFVLIPKRQNIVEWIDLTNEEQLTLCQEIDLVCSVVLKHGTGDKLNIATLGNVVSQFHLHIVYRKKGDRAWPGPIWGTKGDDLFRVNESEKWISIFAALAQS